MGLILHDTLAVTPTGVPLGLVDIQCYARDQATFGKKHQRHALPIEEKESQRWLTSFEATTRLKRQCPKTTVVSIADREADLYDLFLHASSTPHAPQLLVRAFQKRTLRGEAITYFEKLEREPIAGIQTITVPRWKNRKARVASLSVRFLQVTLNPPLHRSQERPVTLWAVALGKKNLLSREVTPSPGCSSPPCRFTPSKTPVSGFGGTASAGLSKSITAP